MKQLPAAAGSLTDESDESPIFRFLLYVSDIDLVEYTFHLDMKLLFEFYGYLSGP